jgi:integrase
VKRALSAAAVSSARARPREYKMTDGGGLYLRVHPSGAKAWCHKYRLHRRQYSFTIGAYPEISLRQARELHERARAAVSLGQHPLELKRRREASTFEAVALEWIEKNSPNWSTSYARQVRRALEANVFPGLGHFPISEVTALQLLAILEEVEARTLPPGKKVERLNGAAAMACFLRQLCGSIFRYAVARRLCERDIAADLRGAIIRPRVRHHSGVARKDIPALVEAARSYGSRSRFANPETGIAIELLLLTFVRTAELRGATWEEIDLDGALWSIKGSRMKMGRDHLVPLSNRAVELLTELKTMGLSSHWLFPNHRDPSRCMSTTSINRALEYMGYGGKLSAHGFRVTASTQLHELGYPPEIIEKQLAHEPKNRVAAAYNQAEYMEQRRRMMQAWGQVVSGAAAL